MPATRPALRFASFDGSSCNFPRPRVPVRPDCRKPGLHRAARDCGAQSAAGSFQHFSRGRYALLEACRRSGLDAASALLVPAYNCRSMLDAAVFLGADVLPYPLRADLHPDMDALDAMAACSEKPVRALLAAHFFGIPQDFGNLAAWCRTRGIVLIEDCSHALFTAADQAPGVGIHGDFVIASPYKFFACPDGGLLYSRATAPGEATAATHRLGWRRELRQIRHALSPTVVAPIRAGDSAQLPRLLTEFRAQAPVRGRDTQLAIDTLSPYFDPADVDAAMSRWSEFVVRHSSPAEIAARRRENFRELVRRLAGLPHATPYYTSIPDTCAPYMFPLRIDHPDPHFFWLKHLGMPIWRWDELPVSACPIAAWARLHLLHIPCHQSLTSVELDWMTEALRLVLSVDPAGA